MKADIRVDDRGFLGFSPRISDSLICSSLTRTTMSSSATSPCITLADIEQARGRIAGSIYLSPCAHSQTLSRLTGQQIYLKLENLQMTGAFKERGALNKLATLSADEAGRGVIAAS